MPKPNAQKRPSLFSSKGWKSRKWLLSLLRARIWAAEQFRPSELQTTLCWAGLVGFFGASVSVLFRKAGEALVHLYAHNSGAHLVVAFSSSNLVAAFRGLPIWERVVVPTVGGLLAGAVLYFAARFKNKSSTDYMEAVVLGDGNISTRVSLIKSLSALFTMSTGGSIGREGPLVQLAALCASLIGRFRKWPTPRRRLIVACGVSAGIASAYNAPISSALFVAEIIIGSIAMETLGPLVFSSVIATLTIHLFMGGNPLYTVPSFRLHSDWEIVPYFGLGLLSGLIAPWFVKFLRLSEKFFSNTKLPLIVRLGFGGAIVGSLAAFHPEVCGNGYSTVSSILNGGYTWQILLVILVFKFIATSATFGSGAVGGVFTPTIFMGASIGYLYGCAVNSIWHFSALSPSALALVGMGAFLAATTHAPIMAIFMLYEMTRDYDIILPLMLGCVVAYYASCSIDKNSIYSESLRRKGAQDFEELLASLHVLDLMKSDPIFIYANARFAEIAENFIKHNVRFLFVVDNDKRFKGVVSLHDIKSYLNEPELAAVVIAEDILHEEFPTITPEVSLTGALEKFAHHSGERLPVLRSEADRTLIGFIGKTDIILALADQAKENPKPLTGYL